MSRFCDSFTVYKCHELLTNIFYLLTYRVGENCRLFKYRMVQKWHHLLYALTLSNINRFSQLFYSQNKEKICNNTITKDPTTPQVCRYTILWHVNCLKSNNWKHDDFWNNIFLTTGLATTCLLSQLLSKVTHMLQFLHQMFNLFALLQDDSLKPAMPLTNGAIDETLQQFAPLSDYCLLQLVDCRESSTLIDHPLKGTSNSAID